MLFAILLSASGAEVPDSFLSPTLLLSCLGSTGGLTWLVLPGHRIPAPSVGSQRPARWDSGPGWAVCGCQAARLAPDQSGTGEVLWGGDKPLFHPPHCSGCLAPGRGHPRLVCSLGTGRGLRMPVFPGSRREAPFPTESPYCTRLGWNQYLVKGGTEAGKLGIPIGSWLSPHGGTCPIWVLT